MDAPKFVVLTEEQLATLLDKAAERAVAKLRGPVSAAPEATTIKAFATAKEISEATVRRMIAEGLPTTRVGRRGVRIPVTQAETWLANRRKAA